MKQRPTKEMCAMSIIIYSRLGDLLRARNLTVRDLRHRITARFGPALDTRTLERLARAERVRRPDLEVAAATADVLGVSLNDVFAVEAVPVNDEDVTVSTDNATVSSKDAESDVLDPVQSHRLETLRNLQDRRSLTPDEQVEMQALVAEWGRRAHEQGLHELALERNLPLEQVRTEVAADFERRLAWWEEVQGDPARLDALVNEAREYQRASIGE